MDRAGAMRGALRGGEAYLPVFEALGRLCRGEDGNEVIALLRQQAPTWLVQMPALFSPTELEDYSDGQRASRGSGCCGKLAEALEGLDR